ncbi:DUF3305 domain-containing protein [Maribius pontilimi]|uniref:DUF3305 domain-containing protein n=1 Tax=Palleronia pontilimi TaxID=1964209 RepID=A0A934IEL6_9RHOB|nr:DUF3305 domain-containing protein [Palleronia pontilimi]MBJ3764211.1 DUF3305 domain-containing protein [Palleronia pontilimi]
MPVGVVVRRLPGVTRWARWSWKAVAVLPGAGQADWKVLREEGDAVEYHAATHVMSLHAGETEAYIHNLTAQEPSIYVIMRHRAGCPPLEVVLVTASPYEAQDYTDNGEDLVERVPMPESLRGVIADFIDRHHVEEPFVKRRRDKARVDRVEDGRGDPRIAQTTDVYRAPRRRDEGDPTLEAAE